MHKCVHKNLVKAAEVLARAYPRLLLTKNKAKQIPADIVKPSNGEKRVCARVRDHIHRADADFVLKIRWKKIHVNMAVAIKMDIFGT
jgi:hypothetical protein